MYIEYYQYIMYIIIYHLQYIISTAAVSTLPAVKELFGSRDQSSFGLAKLDNNSMGIGNTMVEFFSEEIVASV